MAFRIDNSVVRIEIDNRLKDFVMGKIWLTGRDNPVRLSLKGNCLRDIAGCLVILENKQPKAGQDSQRLEQYQEGHAGEITASRRVQELAEPIEVAYKLRKDGMNIPMQTSNCIYIEWFSNSCGRIVIESTNFDIVEISHPEWRMTAEEEDIQLRCNRESIRDYFYEMSDRRDHDFDRSDDEYYPMDEFEWEQGLKDSDELADKYSSLLDKYMDHPDHERIIAREMGWTWLDDALDADERGAFDDEHDEIEDMSPLVPNPMTEGKDWIRTKDGTIKHPLTLRAFESTMEMWHYCKEKGLLGDKGDPDLHEMLFEAQVLGAKLAGALNSLAFDHHPEPGFIIACLKRSLQYFDKSVSASSKVMEKELVKKDKVEHFRNELFEIREEILHLMKYYRSSEL